MDDAEYLPVILALEIEDGVREVFEMGTADIPVDDRMAFGKQGDVLQRSCDAVGKPLNELFSMFQIPSSRLGEILFRHCAKVNAGHPSSGKISVLTSSQG